MHETNRDFRRLEVWQKSHEVTLMVYQFTADFPVEQRFTTANQMQRAAYSIPSNIAEGCGRGGNRELIRFLKIARGSANELEYFVQLTHDLEFIDRAQATTLYR